MKIKQTIYDSENSELMIFTDNILDDFLFIKKRYEDGDSKIHLWYDMPEIRTYEFLWNWYSYIWLWYDREDVEWLEAKKQFDNLIK